MKLITTKDYLLLTDEEAEVCRGQYRLLNDKVELIHEGHNYPYKGFKIIAYLPLTKEAEELDLPLLLNPFKTYRVGRKQKRVILDEKGVEIGIFKTGSEEQAQKYCDYLNNKQFSLEDMKKAIEMAREYEFVMYGNGETEHKYTEQEIIQSLSTQQLPKEFIPEYERVRDWDSRDVNGDYNSKLVLKITTNSEGKEELVGTYKY